MRIAIPTWENRVSPVFDTARHLLIVDVRDNAEVARKQQVLRPMPQRERIELLNRLGINYLICGAITRQLCDGLQNSGVRIIPYVCGDVETILKNFLSGQNIESKFAMPGRKRQRYRGGGQRRQNRCFPQRF